MSHESFAIVVIGTRDTGYGHVTRALALYEAAERSQNVALFALVDQGGKALLPSSPSITPLSSTAELTNELESCAANLLVCDFLEGAEELLELIKQRGGKIISISPISNINSIADLVITRVELDSRGFAGRNLFGLQYLFLPEKDNQYDPKKLRIGINFGGSDPEDLLFELLSNCSQLALPLALNILIGPGYRGRFASVIDSLIENSHLDFTINKTPTEFWSHFSDMDLLVLSGGLTLYEALERSIPVIALMPDPTKVSLIPRELRALAFPRVVTTPAECVEEIKKIALSPDELEIQKRSISGITFKGNVENVLAVIAQYV